jgi:hypothetical protein
VSVAVSGVHWQFRIMVRHFLEFLSRGVHLFGGHLRVLWCHFGVDHCCRSAGPARMGPWALPTLIGMFCRAGRSIFCRITPPLLLWLPIFGG